MRIFCLVLLPALLLVCAGAAAQSTLDGFDPDVNGPVEVMAVQPDGRILLGGDFTQVGGQSRSYIARLSLPEAALQELVITADRSGLRWWRDGAGPEVSQLRFAVADDFDDPEAWVDLGEAERMAGDWAIDGLDAHDLPRHQNLWLRAEGIATGGYSNASTSRHQSLRQVFLLAHSVTAMVGSGNGDIDPLVQTIDDGSDADFIVTPDSGWQVLSVDGDTCTPEDNGDGTWVAVDITEDCAITANFEIDTYTVTAMVGSGNGSIGPPTQTIDHGSAADFTVTPDTGWHVLSVDGDTCTPEDNGDGSWTAEGISADCHVEAGFVLSVDEIFRDRFE